MAIKTKTAVTFIGTCDLCEARVKASVRREVVEHALVEHRRTCPKELHRCDNCNATKDRCSDLCVRNGRPCCEECFLTDTHHDTFEASVDSLRRAFERRDAKRGRAGGSW